VTRLLTRAGYGVAVFTFFYLLAHVLYAHWRGWL